MLGKLKSLLAFLKFSFVFTFFAFLFVYAKAFGLKFGAGFALLLLFHEMGHYLEIKRRGIHANLPIFIPGIGAYVKWTGQGVSLRSRGFISLAGPVAGLVSAAICLAIWWKTHLPVWGALARTAAWLNAVNLVPYAILDGAGVFLASGVLGRILTLTTGLVLWQMTGEGVFLVVGGVGLWMSIMASDEPMETWQHSAAAVAVLALLAAVMMLIPKPVGIPSR